LYTSGVEMGQKQILWGLVEWNRSYAGMAEAEMKQNGDGWRWKWNNIGPCVDG